MDNKSGQAAVDKDAFFRRIRSFYSAWKNSSSEYSSLNKCDAIVIGVGSIDDITYSKSTALQIWLLGYELADIVTVFCKKSIHILASKKKVEFLKTIESSKENEEGVPPISLLVREKADKDAANFEKLLEAIEKSGNGRTVGEVSKDKFSGEFIEDWLKKLAAKQFDVEDISVPLACLMAVKDETELTNLTKASNLSCDLYYKYLREEITEIIDSDKKVRHQKLSDGVDQASNNKKYIKNVDLNQVDLCYPAIIQSGGRYNLKFSVSSDKNNLHFGAITCCLGMRYKQYCSNLVRTLLVNPTSEQKEMYDFLLKVQEAVIDKLRDGVVLSTVYNMAADLVAKKDKRLLDKFTKSIGFGIGIEFRDAALQITSKTMLEAKKNMCFSVHVGFSNLDNKEAKDDESKVYALFIGDTVVVNDEAKPATVLTQCKKKLQSISIIISEEDEEEDEEEEEKQAKKKDKLVEEAMTDAMYGRGRRTALVESKLRSEPTTEDRRRRHQKELAESLNEAAKARLAAKSGNKSEEKARKSNVSYKSQSQMPNEKEISELKIYVDKKYETIILPIFGIPVPYHISTIKNISQSIEGDYTYLRINFFTPGTNIGKAESALFANYADTTFLKEVTYRSTNLKEAGEISAPCSNLNTAFRLIKEVQKKFKTREAEEREKEGIVKQDSLQLSTNKSNPKLKDLYIRPNIVTKRIQGTLEAHVNGFRFTSIRGDKIDIMYNNIKHAFFQPCDGEMVIILHFHLKNAIMFGKKKQNDIQFYTEVGEITTDLGKHQHMHDRDDLAAEQAEREMRNKLKLAFKSFCDKVEAMTKNAVEFDTPFRDLGFHGVPNRSSVFLQPTSGCLVHLTEWPPFVITLEDVELVHFERVQFHLKNFDMVFVFKDYHRKTVMVASVPMQMLDNVKDWLNSCDIRYTEGIQSLNWAKIMKTINDDPDDFFERGGWDFLDDNNSDEEAHLDEEDEDDEVYDPTDSELSEEESESEFSDDSVVSEGDDSDENSLGSSEESGKDWSELEEEAAEADKDHERGFVDDYTAKKRKVLDKKSDPHSGKRRADDSSSSKHNGSGHKKMKKK